MKLLKYVMTKDSGLAPNPYFGVCSLALCTPNHMNAQLQPGDWVVAHSSARTGHRLVYAMRLTEVLDMQSYFLNFPEKRPVQGGSYEQLCGDNLYFREGKRWARLPSAEHNSEDAFVQDCGRRVYIAEGSENYWYFGAGRTLVALEGFADRFPWLLKDRCGFSYIRDQKRIAAFVSWLQGLDQHGKIGQPRDRVFTHADRYLVSIDPMPRWVAENSPPPGQNPPAAELVLADSSLVTQGKGCAGP
jgi:hypothetical protein